ncbi:MAG: single-strand DNA-binding protein [Parvicellaceae bacterium]|jgi:single-strand DNA-binding protein
MNNLRNRVQLIGNIGQTPEIFNFDGDKKKAAFSIATSEKYRNKKGELVSETHWHNVVAWGKSAAVIEQFCEKGSELCVSGMLITRSYDDKDGNKRFITEVKMTEMLMLDKKN